MPLNQNSTSPLDKVRRRRPVLFHPKALPPGNQTFTQFFSGPLDLDPRLDSKPGISSGALGRLGRYSRCNAARFLPTS
ncbi:hypothetical protein M378DRAFT_164283, partial [Amanita muscaria Koide BX008]